MAMGRTNWVWARRDDVTARRVYSSIEQFSSKIEIYAGSVSTVYNGIDSATLALR